ncbi:MAG: type IV pilus assembly protein PilM [Planctomycetota bacterium]|jgi:type IV pilus assembly protein PilM
MAHPKAAWGMEIGAHAIKAIRLERDGDRVTVADFAVIPHKKVLTTPDLDQDEMIRLGLGQFISQKDLEGETLVMSVPGHTAFARFAKLPPVEPKKVPDIVKFEAVQQIPFPIDDVEWDYQTFTAADSPEVEVGIFAITRERVQQRLGLYAELGVTPESLTLSPVAVYNAMAFDHDLAGHDGPILYLDIGTNATDVAEEGRCWIRTFPLGGTHFTEAIASAFKLSYSKADKLKREAATSKYAKQIMQAMRPVFSDLLQDLQRSIGYYQTLHPDSSLDTMVGLGSTFKIPGLRKFLGQQLQINVVRLDEYKKISVSGREAASFAESAVNMATAYGLALQGLGLGEISANLVPVKTLRDQMWHAKTKWFAAAAAIVIAGAGMMLYRPLTDRAALRPGGLDPVVQTVISRGDELKRQYEDIQRTVNVGFTAENMRGLFDERRVWPFLVHDAADALASTEPQAELLSETLEEIGSVPAEERRLVQLEELSAVYSFDGEQKSRRMQVTMEVELSHENPVVFLRDTVAVWLEENAEREGVPYRILPDTIRLNAAQVQTLRVDESGEAAVDEGRPTPPPRPDRAGGTGPAPPRPTGPRPGSAGGNTGRGMNPGGQPISAPGTGGDDFRAGGGGAGPAPAPAGRGRPGSGRGRFGSGGPPRAGGPGGPDDGVDRGDDGMADIDLEVWAPVPGAPAFYPPKSKYYRVPVTFEIEIVDPSKPAPPAATAAGDGAGGVS